MPSNSKKSTAPSEDKYAAQQWGGSAFIELEVPSGQLCLVRRPGVEGLINAGVLQSLDSLSAIVYTEHVEKNNGKRPPKQRDIKDIVSDEAAMISLIHTLDKITCYVVVKPEVQMTPNDITNRKDGVVYADMIDIGDKMFIMNFAIGGTRDLERFREEYNESLASLELGKNLEHAS